MLQKLFGTGTQPIQVDESYLSGKLTCNRRKLILGDKKNLGEARAGYEYKTGISADEWGKVAPDNGTDTHDTNKTGGSDCNIETTLMRRSNYRRKDFNL